MPDDPNINEYGVSHDDWDDMSQNEQRDTAHEHGDDWLGKPPPGTDGGDDSSQQTTASADTGRPPTFHSDTPPTFHSDAQQEAWLADQRAKLWDSYELERRENVQKGRDDWSRSNKEREDRLRSERRDEAADQAREEREKQESRWSTEDEGEGLLRSRDRERYVDRDMEASKDPNVNEYGISHNDWDDLSQNEQRDVAHSFGDDWHGQPPLTDASGGFDLFDKGLTPDEIAFVRERQGGTITKFEQDDADAVNARRDALGAQAVDEQFEAALLAQGATPEEIAYVRERQGGTITKFEQDDADAVNARRGVLGAQAVAEQVEAALVDKGLTPDEIAYVRERQGGTITKFEQDDANAVNARRDALAARDDEANRLELVAANELYAESMGEFGSRDGTFDLAARNEDALAEYQRLVDLWEDESSMGAPQVHPDLAQARAIRANPEQYQRLVDLWEAEDSMGAPEVSPDLALARAVQMSLDSGEQIDLPHSFEAEFGPHGPPERDPATLRMAQPDPMAEGQETVEAETIYALAFPGRSPEEIAAARDLYPSRTSFDREAIDRAKLTTRNDPAQSAMVDEFAISKGYQPLELDMSADAVNERRKRVIGSTAALWTLPFTFGWGAARKRRGGSGNRGRSPRRSSCRRGRLVGTDERGLDACRAWCARRRYNGLRRSPLRPGDVAGRREVRSQSSQVPAGQMGD